MQPRPPKWNAPAETPIAVVSSGFFISLGLPGRRTPPACGTERQWRKKGMVNLADIFFALGALMMGALLRFLFARG